MNIFAYFKNLINKDIVVENELKDLTVLLRILCLIDVLANLLYAGGFGCALCSEPVIYSVVFMVIFAGILIASYRSRSKLLLLMYMVTEVVFCVLFCMKVSGGLGYRFEVVPLIPLLYYKADETRRFKILSSICIALLSLVLGVTSIFQVPSYVFVAGFKVYIICVETVVITAKLMVISLFYYRKFAADESKIISYSKKLEILATQDPLTKLQNRRGLMDYMRKITEGPSSAEVSLNISISDIDFFKNVNDTYGHEAGDYVLETIGQILTKHIEKKGRVARWGGEEFLLLYENMNGDDAFVFLDFLRHEIKNYGFVYRGQKIPITMTFGLEEYNPNTSIETTIEKADEKLYIGKQQGRDRVIY